LIWLAPGDHHHHGRHTFVSHAVAGRNTLTEVRIAAGHRKLAGTGIYLRVAVDDDGGIGDLFRVKP
jgi:site-specific recombinase XerC